MRLRKSAKAIDEPFGGEVRRRADGEDTRGLALHQTLGADRDAIERVAQNGEVVATGLGDDQALALAIEELDAELRFQSLDLMAYPARGPGGWMGCASGARAAVNADPSAN